MGRQMLRDACHDGVGMGLEQSPREESSRRVADGIIGESCSSDFPEENVAGFRAARRRKWIA
jgi:hypothetical protein